MGTGIYLLLNKDRIRFKIGKANDIDGRAFRLSKDWDIDFKASFYIQTDKPIKLEKALQNLLDDFNVVNEDESHKNGFTEWFNIQGLELCQNIIKTMGLTSVQGVYLEGQKDKKNISRERSRNPKNFTIAQQNIEWLDRTSIKLGLAREKKISTSAFVNAIIDRARQSDESGNSIVIQD